MSDLCACVYLCACVCAFHSTVCVHIPQKDFKTRKKEKHATKIPSSRGLFIEDSSCFFVSGPRVKKKRGEKEKRENSKKITGKNRKKEYQKKKRSKSKKDKSARVHVCLLFCFFFFLKKSTKTKTKGITDTDLSQEKTQDQDFGCDFQLFPLQKKMAAIVYGPTSSLSLSLSFKPLLAPRL